MSPPFLSACRPLLFKTISSSGEAWLAAIAVNVGMTMNKNYSRNYVMEGLRGVGRPYRLEHPQSVHETWRETSTIYVALIDSREPRTADHFSLFHATRLPPCNGSSYSVSWELSWRVRCRLRRPRTSRMLLQLL